MFVCDTEIKPGEKKRLAIPVPGVGVLWCIILTVRKTMWTQEVCT